MKPKSSQKIPSPIYGTAFAFDETTSLVEAALHAGFRGIDTAGALGAYREKMVGDGIRNCVKSGLIKRDDLYIQTKFSPYKPGKDPALYPYDTTVDIETQVQQSVASSLSNLGTDYIDCLVLHSLYADFDDTLRAWRAMEAFVPAQIGLLGVSNTDLGTLRRIYDLAGTDTKPVTVQNRFTQSTSSDPLDPKMPPGIPYPDDKYDAGVRDFCAKYGIKYTPWGVLWGSPELLEGIEADHLSEIADEIGVTKQVAFYVCLQDIAFVDGCEVGVLCGTKTIRRMSETIHGLQQIGEFLAASPGNKERWKRLIDGFRKIIGTQNACGYQGKNRIGIT
ncbi:hypothetical protein N0V93_006259 [Gnomoniopsis smithogilvyi]|uniref:NADP-dependent oxidoreductase domain-containing protein n=1 Tax=Gnomoniopsis smithogilvyi TaxID=1191159 RepID=A0A9W8YP12_9PEZI|nr:hypothetical protein N0V93_006259 [Gnomoniopsis smithogilvyi]